MTPTINWHPTVREIRQFGLVLWVGFTLIGAGIFWKGHLTPAQWIWAVTTGIAVLSWIAPTAARPFYWAWMGIGLIIGSVMSRVVMALVFFGILTPVAIYFRLIKRDALGLRRTDRPTYWNDHPEIPKKNYARLF